jgi:hypothetical protein
MPGNSAGKINCLLLAVPPIFHNNYFQPQHKPFHMDTIRNTFWFAYYFSNRLTCLEHCSSCFISCAVQGLPLIEFCSFRVKTLLCLEPFWGADHDPHPTILQDVLFDATAELLNQSSFSHRNLGYIGFHFVWSLLTLQPCS